MTQLRDHLLESALDWAYVARWPRGDKRSLVRAYALFALALIDDVESEDLDRLRLVATDIVRTHGIPLPILPKAANQAILTRLIATEVRRWKAQSIGSLSDAPLPGWLVDTIAGHIWRASPSLWKAATEGDWREFLKRRLARANGRPRLDSMNNVPSFVAWLSKRSCSAAHCFSKPQ